LALDRLDISRHHTCRSWCDAVGYLPKQTLGIIPSTGAVLSVNPTQFHRLLTNLAPANEAVRSELRDYRIFNHDHNSVYSGWPNEKNEKAWDDLILRE
jgi:hypothetical protein